MAELSQIKNCIEQLRQELAAFKLSFSESFNEHFGYLEKLITEKANCDLATQKKIQAEIILAMEKLREHLMDHSSTAFDTIIEHGDQHWNVETVQLELAPATIKTIAATTYTISGCEAACATLCDGIGRDSMLVGTRLQLDYQPIMQPDGSFAVLVDHPCQDNGSYIAIVPTNIDDQGKPSTIHYERCPPQPPLPAASKKVDKACCS